MQKIMIQEIGFEIPISAAWGYLFGLYPQPTEQPL